MRIELLGGNHGGITFAASPLLSVAFPQSVQVRHAWVVKAKSTGDTVFGWDASGETNCDVTDFSSPFPSNVTAQQLARPRGQVAATPPPAATALPTAAPVSSSACDRPFVAATTIVAQTPDYPGAVAERGFRGRATVVLKVAIDEGGKPTDAWVVESSGYKEFDETAITAALHSSYRPAVAYCRNVKGYYYFTADFETSV